MSHLIEAADLSTAWIEAVRHLGTQPNRQAWDLVVAITNSEAERPGIRAHLESLLAERRLQSVSTVANTVFPASLWRTSRSRNALYERYERILPKLRHCRGNGKGMYFERLISWPPKSTTTWNQLEAVIQRLQSELVHPNTKRFVYDLALFSPAHDAYPVGFPCLTYVNLKLRGRQLCMLAHYRNHYFLERAYGNYVGLAGLQGFIASAAGIGRGELVCVSAHATLDLPRRAVQKLLAAVAAD